MSAKIWQEIQAAVHEQNSELDDEFNSCRDEESIKAFLNEHFPLVDDSWDDKLSSQIPGLLRNFQPPAPEPEEPEEQDPNE